ncbi:flavodoxin family protein [Enterococcus hirae]|nr:flavodoxin family protein [Enterococcus hirae]
MKIAVRFYSRSGNTQKVAEAIAKAVGTEAKKTDVSVNEPVDLLFLGGSVYWGGIDKNLRAFIESLDPAKVKCVATFGTSALKKEPDREAAKLLSTKGIKVASSAFRCDGAFAAFHKGHPDEADLKAAAAFAKKIVAEQKE